MFSFVMWHVDQYCWKWSFFSIKLYSGFFFNFSWCNLLLFIYRSLQSLKKGRFYAVFWSVHQNCRQWKLRNLLNCFGSLQLRTWILILLYFNPSSIFIYFSTKPLLILYAFGFIISCFKFYSMLFICHYELERQ